MVYVALLLAVVAVVLAGVAVRARARVTVLSEELAAAREGRQAAEAAARAARSVSVTAGDERDDALARLARARRDAAEAAELRDAELWSLALAGVQRTWEVSVCPSPGLASPLQDSDDELRTAVEIEVDAAREEAGAAIELDWHGHEVAPVAVALRTLSLARELIARLAKVAERATMVVESTGGAVTLTVEAVDARGVDVVPDDVAPAYRTGRGTYVLGAAAVGERDPAGTTAVRDAPRGTSACG